jgi:hypothetical protein
MGNTDFEEYSDTFRSLPNCRSSFHEPSDTSLLTDGGAAAINSASILERDVDRPELHEAIKEPVENFGIEVHGSTNLPPIQSRRGSGDQGNNLIDFGPRIASAAEVVCEAVFHADI